jgi:shikimate kinase
MIYTIIGFMGSGKTTIGKQLANKLKYNFIDLDEFIEKNLDMSILSIFSNKGESYFRDIETSYLKKALELKDSVISLGGGTPCFNNNMDIIKRHSKSIFIDLPVKMLADRLKNAKLKRPLINNKSDIELIDFIDTLRSERLSYYNQADFKIKERENVLIKINSWINTNKH